MNINIHIYIYCIYICIFAVLFFNCLHDLPTLNGDYIIYDISADVDVCIATIYIYNYTYVIKKGININIIMTIIKKNIYISKEV